MIHNLHKSKGAAALFSAAFLYATFGLFARELAHTFSDTAQTAARLALAAIIMLVVNVLRRRNVRLPSVELFKACLLGVAFAAVVLLFTISVNATKLANSVYLLYAGSIISSLLIGTIVFKEKLTTNKSIAVCLALCGLLMYSGSLVDLNAGIIAGAAAGLFDGVGNAIRKGIKTTDRSVLLMWQYAASGLVSGIFMALYGGRLLTHGDVGYAASVTLVVFSILLLCLGNLLLYGFQHFDLNVGTILLTVELVFVAIFGFVFYKEVPAKHEVAGGICIFVASVLTAFDIRKAQSLFRWPAFRLTKRSS